MRYFSKFLLTSLLVCFLTETQAVIRYVRPTLFGSGDASSWQNATNDLQLAINNSAAGDTVFVAAGTYLPNRRADALHTITPNDIDNAFVLKADVRIFGGFPNTGTATWTQRDWNANPTILSGDIGTVNYMDDNCRHVVISSGNVGTACLDGFTITKGYGSVTEDIYKTVTVNGNQIQRYFSGGICNIRSSPTLTNLVIDNNQTQLYGGLGGGIYNGYSSPVITSVVITNNYSNGAGGIYNEYSSPVLTDVTISNNVGHGIMSYDGSSPILTNVTISNNNGFGIANYYDSSPILTDVTINNNNRSGILNHSSSPILTNVTISNNTYSIGDGGGMINENSSPVLTNVIITKNSARLGGGIYNTGGSSPVLTDVLISENTATDDGGAIYNINPNSVANLDAFPILTNVTIIENQAGNNGGAIYNRNSSPVLTNVLIAKNRARSGGGGIYNVLNFLNFSFSFVLTNVTISNNVIETVGKGGGIYTESLSASSSFAIRNSIVWGNRNWQDSATDVENAGSKAITYLNSLVGGEPLGNGIISNGNPQFIDMENSNYRLNYYSSAIDVGDNTCYDTGNTPNLSAISEDLDGNPRIFNNIVDLGAYEALQVSITFCEDTLICYGDTARISFHFAGIPPWMLIYTKDDGATFDTLQPIVDSLFYLDVSPLNTTTYKFVSVGNMYYMRPLTDSMQIQVIVPVFTNSFFNDSLCSGSKTQSVVFSGVATNFEWVASGDTIKNIPAGIQAGNFGEYLVENKGDTLLTSFITVKPQYRTNGKICVGEDTTFSITVYPEPQLTTLLQNDTLCDGETTTPVQFTGADFYEWTATDAVSGLPTGVQRGDFGAYTVGNKTTNIIKSSITVTPINLVSGKECRGTSQTFEIVVNSNTRILSLLPDVNILSICEAKEIQMEVNASGKELVYQWYFNDMPLQGEENSQLILPSVSDQTMGVYYVEVSGVCGNAKSHSITLDAGTIKVLVENECGDEILVDNSSRKFTAYQWYKDGVAVPGATKQIYTEKGGLHGCYSVELTLTNRSKTFACERCFDKAKKIISVYPNLVKVGEIIKVHFSLPPNGYVRFVRAELYNPIGQLVMQQQIDTDGFEIETVDLSAGVYVLKMITEDFCVYEEKVGVY